jgi:hypothetical protein
MPLSARCTAVLSFWCAAFWRYLVPCTVAALLVMAALPSWSDVIPPSVAQARERLRANPDTYDMVDQFCSGKKRGAECVIAGNAFDGGGQGICDPIVSDKIYLTCVRLSSVSIDRQLPEGGYTSSDPLCQDYLRAVAAGQAPAGRPMDCDPDPQPVSDRFCRGMLAGSACVAEMRVDGRTETHPGACKTAQQSKYGRYGGRPQTLRTVLTCEPAKRTGHSYSPASWLDKLKQQ